MEESGEVDGLDRLHSKREPMMSPAMAASM